MCASLRDDEAVVPLLLRPSLEKPLPTGLWAEELLGASPAGVRRRGQPQRGALDDFGQASGSFWAPDSPRVQRAVQTRILQPRPAWHPHWATKAVKPRGRETSQVTWCSGQGLLGHRQSSPILSVLRALAVQGFPEEGCSYYPIVQKRHQRPGPALQPPPTSSHMARRNLRCQGYWLGAGEGQGSQEKPATSHLPVWT